MPLSPSLEEKEALYIAMMDKLQERWGNPTTATWKPGYTDEAQLDRMIARAKEHLKHYRRMDQLKELVKIPFYLFVGLGSLGLLIFGIKQLLAFVQ